MIAVIFEVLPDPAHKQEYLDIAAQMRPMLDKVDGFISIERFQSLTNPDKLLSLSFFRDETAVKAWRTLSAHRSAQNKGRAGVFEDYHLRIAHVIRDYGMFDREQAPEDSRKSHDKWSPRHRFSSPIKERAGVFWR
ncbi:MAG: antibiotic biosynthesis monooxygenase [Sulfitobacter sp.]